MLSSGCWYGGRSIWSLLGTLLVLFISRSHCMSEYEDKELRLLSYRCRYIDTVDTAYDEVDCNYYGHISDKYGCCLNYDEDTIALVSCAMGGTYCPAGQFYNRKDPTTTTPLPPKKLPVFVAVLIGLACLVVCIVVAVLISCRIKRRRNKESAEDEIIL